MKGQVKNSSHLADHIKVEMAAPALEKEHALKCVAAAHSVLSPEDLEVLYLNWAASYAKVNCRLQGVYRPTGPCTWAVSPFGEGKAKSVLQILRRFAILPHSTVPVLKFPSDEEAILNDWAMVGADIFQAVRQFKSGTHVASSSKSAESPESSPVSK